MGTAIIYQAKTTFCPFLHQKMTFFAQKMPFLVIFAPKMAIFHFFGHWVCYLAARALRRAKGERRGNFNRSTASIIHSGRPLCHHFVTILLSLCQHCVTIVSSLC